MAVAEPTFIEQLIALDGVAIAREDGTLIAARDLSNDHVALEDVVDLAHDHGRHITNIEVDMTDAETRIHLQEGPA